MKKNLIGEYKEMLCINVASKIYVLASTNAFSEPGKSSTGVLRISIRTLRYLKQGIIY